MEVRREARRPVAMYFYQRDEHEPLNSDGLAWLADQLCSEERVHPERTMSIGWITTQAAYEFPALLDKATTQSAEIERLQARVAELEVALEPFGKAAAAVDSGMRIVTKMPSELLPNYYLRGQDFLDARTTLGADHDRS